MSDVGAVAGWTVISPNISHELVMPQEFDPYFEWLKIPPSEQPPNHYRLLNMARFESDPAIIESAVSRLVARLQNLSNGQHVAHSQRILNDVAKARMCLGDAQSKSAYDDQLRLTSGFGKLSQAVSNTTKKPTRQTTAPATKPDPRSGARSSASAPHERPKTPTKTSPKPTGNQEMPLNKKVTSANKTRRAGLKAGPKKNTPATKKGKAKPKSATGLLIGYSVGAIAAAAVALFVLKQQFREAPTPTVAVNKSEFKIDPPRSDDAAKNLSSAAASRIQKVPAAEQPNSRPTVPPADPLDADRNPTTAEISADLLDTNSETVDIPPPPIPDEPPVANPMPTPPPALPEMRPAETPETNPPTAYTPDQLTVLEAMLGEVVHVTGTVVSGHNSSTGKTRYLHFSEDRDKTIMVFMHVSKVGDEITEEVLQSYVGKKILVRAAVEREWPTNKLGLKIYAKSEIEIVE